MGSEPGDDRTSVGSAVLLVLLPIAGGGLLFLLFDAGPVHGLGLYLIGAGVIVGAALLLSRTAW